MAMEQPDQRKRQYNMMRSTMDYGMGIVIVGVGIFFLVSDHFGISFGVEPFFKYFFSGMCLLYGGWRIYRGYKKNYYSE